MPDERQALDYSYYFLLETSSVVHYYIRTPLNWNFPIKFSTDNKRQKLREGLESIAVDLGNGIVRYLANFTLDFLGHLQGIRWANSFSSATKWWIKKNRISVKFSYWTTQTTKPTYPPFLVGRRESLRMKNVGTQRQERKRKVQQESFKDRDKDIEYRIVPIRFFFQFNFSQLICKTRHNTLLIVAVYNKRFWNGNWAIYF